MTLSSKTAKKLDSIATFSADRQYRYWLERSWGDSTRLGFLMLNPSTADEVKNDPTVERCQRRAIALGYGGFVVVNIFALRSTDPKGLYKHASPISEPGDLKRNDRAIMQAVKICGKLVAGWGVHGEYESRYRDVCRMLRGFDLWCLGKTKDGHPKHPLYIPYSKHPERFVLTGVV